MLCAHSGRRFDQARPPFLVDELGVQNSRWRTQVQIHGCRRPAWPCTTESLAVAEDRISVDLVCMVFGDTMRDFAAALTSIGGGTKVNYCPNLNSRATIAVARLLPCTRGITRSVQDCVTATDHLRPSRTGSSASFSGPVSCQEPNSLRLRATAILQFKAHSWLAWN